VSALKHRSGKADASGLTHLQICTKCDGDFVSASNCLFASTISLYRSADKVKVNVKQSRYRPGVAQRVPGS
jgi:hypothetical protein